MCAFPPAGITLDLRVRRSLLSTNIPTGAPKGSYEMVVAFFDPSKPITGRGDAFLDVSSHFIIQ